MSAKKSQLASKGDTSTMANSSSKPLLGGISSVSSDLGERSQLSKLNGSNMMSPVHVTLPSDVVLSTILSEEDSSDDDFLLDSQAI